MGQKIATLEIELGMATGTAVSDLQRFGGTVDSVSAQAIRDLDRIDAAIKGVGNLDAVTASAVRLAETTARTALEMARDADRSERAGERMVGQLERQIAVYGLTREQVRALRAEEAARAADQNGQAELAGRIRGREAQLYDLEFAAARKAQQAAAAAAEEAALAAEKVAQAKEREAQAVRSAAHAYQMFEARAREGLVAWKEEEAARARAVAEAAVNAQLLERSHIEAALARTMGTDRPRATDAGATFGLLAAQAAEEDARAQRAAATAADTAARAHASLAAAVRESHAAQMADAEAAERLRAATDPLYAATARLNAEIAESTRLYHAGATAPAEYARQQEVLAGRLRAVGQSQAEADLLMRRGAGTLTQFSFQLNDVATMAALGAPPMQIFASQAGQIFQIAQMAEGGVKGFAAEVGGLTMRFAPLLAVAAVAGVALYQFKQSVNDDANMKAYVRTLGLTEKEMKKLGDQSVTTGDLLKGFWRAVNEGDGSGPTLMSRLFTDADKQTLQGLLDFTLNVFKGIAAAAYGLIAGSYRAGIAIWQQFPDALGDIFVQAVNGAASAIEFLVNNGVEAVNAIARAGNAIIGKDVFGQFEQVTIARMDNPFKGAAAQLGVDIYEAFDGAAAEGLKGIDRIIAQTGKFAVESAQERARKKANEIIGDRTPKTDKHAEKLARDAAATEAQIRNLYALAEAYRISGGEALIAEARVKAESKAIKQRADIEQVVNREVRLAIAQRVSDAAKSTAAMRDEAAIRRQANADVEAGLLPAERANDLVRDRIAELPLLAALEAANKRGLTDAAAAAARALSEQRAARAALTAQEDAARATERMQAGRDQLAMIELEGRLLGATTIERERALATLRAEQEARKTGAGPDWVQQQVDIAVATERGAIAQRQWNEALTFTDDQWELIARNVSNAAQGMADAFGEVGRAIGDMASIYASYRASQERGDAVHRAAIKEAGDNERAVARENARYTLTNATRQIGLYGDMATAARGFFKEGSDGYKGLTTAIQVFRAIEFALSVRAMAQDAIETASSLAKSTARAVAHGVEAVAKAIASLPFPANLAAGAATLAALAAIGVSIVGSIGGSGGAKPPETNKGAGTVLGDPAAQSDSIRRGLDALREVDTLTNVYSRQMLQSLRSIDNQIGGVASVIARGGDINASEGVTEGFKKNIIGSVLGSIPLLGNLLGGLFGSKTTVVGSGLYGGAQSIGSILDNGFDASTYSDIQKKSKFFGITTSTKYRTQYGAADPGLENQFTLILRDFNNAIVSAAEPLGQATGDIEARLRGFVVNIGRIDLKGLTGEQVQERLAAIFGAAADNMANAAFPGIERFQKVGEGAFETLVRVASTVEQVTNSLAQLGNATVDLSIDAKLGLAAQFESIGDFTSAIGGFFDAFYTPAEKAAASTAQLTRVFTSIGVTMPDTLASYRALVEAQNLNTAAGQETYATLLQLAPAFADLKKELDGAKSAADILAERADLERKLLELRGDTAALRALELAKLDPSNRALQQQIYAIQDAQDAAKAADELRKAWSSVGDSIMDEVRRIRGLDAAQGPAGFAGLMGQFNSVTAAARAGDMEAAKQLPALSRSLLDAAAKAATSRQELDRVQGEAAASLEATYAALAGYGDGSGADEAVTKSAEAMAQAATAATTAAASSSALVDTVRLLREEIAGMRADNNAGHAETARQTGRTAKTLENVSRDDAIAVVNG